MSDLRRAVYWSAAAKYSNIAIQSVAVIVLARLLTPEDIGVFSVAFALTTLAHTLREFGVTQYVVQVRHLDRATLRNAFGIALVVGVSVGGLLFAAGGPASRFYGAPDLGRVLRVLAVTFLLIPVSIVAYAMLTRTLRFRTLYGLQLVGGTVQVATSIALAGAGAGPVSMAWGTLASAVVTVAVLAVRFPQWVFIRPSFREWRPVAGFGSWASATALVTEIGLAIPDLVIGRLLGFSAVAYYSRALGLINLYRQSVEAALLPVALPGFAAGHHAGTDLRPDYRRATALLTGIAWPFFAVLAVLAGPVIQVLFGDQWQRAVPVTRILCLAFAIQATVFLAGPLLVALGEVRRNFYRELALQGLKVALVAAAVSRGLEAVATAEVAAYALYAGLTLYLLNRRLGLTAGDLLSATRRSAVVTLTSLAGPAAVVAGAGGAVGAGIVVVIGGAAAALGWLAGAFATGHPIQEEIRLGWRDLRSAWVR